MTFHVAHYGDSFALMAKYWAERRARCYDVIITDPPYPEHVQNNLCSGSLLGTKSVPKYKLLFPAMTPEQYTWGLHAATIAKRWVVTFCAVEDFGLYRIAAPEAYIRGCIWYKSNSMGQLSRDRPATAYEGVTLLHAPQDGNHPKKRWNGRGSYGIWRCNGTRGKVDRHPNEKPLDLVLKLVALFSERGETIFDPFCGSGAIGEAALRLGRNYVGFDNDTTWVEKARARLTKAQELVDKGITMADDKALNLCTMPRVIEPAHAWAEEEQAAA